MRIYLSGPVSFNGTASQQERARRTEVFTREAERLRELGHEVINPCECEEQASWEDFMKIHLPNVCRSEFVATLPDWEFSRGSLLEVYVAEQLLIPVVRAEGFGLHP